jgi:hypothetical protein
LREETSQRIRLHNSSGLESCAPPIVFFSLTAVAHSCLSGTLKGPSSVTTYWIQKKGTRDYADQRLPPSALLLLEVQHRLVSLYVNSFSTICSSLLSLPQPLSQQDSWKAEATIEPVAFRIAGSDILGVSLSLA